VDGTAESNWNLKSSFKTNKDRVSYGSVFVCFKWWTLLIFLTISKAKGVFYRCKIWFISKCLATGADQVIVLSSDKKHLQALEENLSSKFSDQANLLFFTADKLIIHLDKIRAKAASKEKTVKGYKVKVKYASTSKDEAQAKKDAIAKILVGTIRQ